MSVLSLANIVYSKITNKFFVLNFWESQKKLPNNLQIKRKIVTLHRNYKIKRKNIQYMNICMTYSWWWRSSRLK